MASCYIGKQDIIELHKALKVLNDSNRFCFIVGYNADNPENITYERFDEDRLAIILKDNENLLIQTIAMNEINIIIE